SSTMAGDNALHGRQADASTGKFTRRMEPLEGQKELIDPARIKARAVVTHEVNPLRSAERLAELDGSMAVAGGVFPCVAEEVLHDDAHQPAIGVDHRCREDRECHFTIRLFE